MKFSFFSLITLFSASLIMHASDNHTSHLEKIVFGSGCFWGAEKGYEGLQGVEDAVSGYADGYGIKPTYREIIKIKNRFKENNFAEVVEVTFNNEVITPPIFVKIKDIPYHNF